MHIIWYQEQLLYSSEAFSHHPPIFFARYFDGNSVTRWFHTIEIFIITHPPLYNITKMGRKKSVLIDRVKKAEELRLKDPFLWVLEAMLVTCYERVYM